MLNTWLISFILGSILGRCSGGRTFELLLFAKHLPWVVGAFLVWGSLNLRGCWLKIQLLLVGLAGMVWGLAHSAPELANNMDEAVIVQAEGPMNGRGPVLIQKDQKIFLSSGPSLLGAIGSVTALEQPGPMHRFHSTLHIVAARSQEAKGFEQVGLLLRRFYRAHLRHLPRTDAQWILAGLLGERSALAPDLRRASQSIGLHQIATVSGIQVVLITTMMSFFLRALPVLAYALRMISAVQLRHIMALTHILVAGAAVFYLVLVGAPLSAQRATLTAIVWHLSYVFTGVMPTPMRLRLIAGFQCFCFPLGFMTGTSILGWMVYIVILASLETQGRSHLRTLRGALALQGKIILLITGLFGQINLIAGFLWPALAPLMSVLLLHGLLSVHFHILMTSIGISEFYTLLNSFVLSVSNVTERFPWLVMPQDSLPSWVQPAALVLATILLLNSCRALVTLRFHRR